MHPFITPDTAVIACYQVLEGKEDKYGELLSDAVAQLGAIEDAETGELVDRTLEFWVPQKEMMVSKETCAPCSK